MRAWRIISVLLAFALLAAVPAWAQEDDENQVDTSLLPDSSFIYDTTIYALQHSDTYYEGQTVQVTGEVVGDIIAAEGDDGHKWITVDSLPDERTASVQVYVSESQASNIDTLGRFEQTGTTVEVTGKYHLVCDQHDGLSDIHATSVNVLERGSSSHTSFSFGPFVPAIALLVAGLALYFLYRRKRKEQM